MTTESSGNTSAESKVKDNNPSFAFEQVAVKLEPFDLVSLLDRDRDKAAGRLRAVKEFQNRLPTTLLSQRASSIKDESSRAIASNALLPILSTNGLVFPYNPSISEGVDIRYDAVELTHANESFHVYRNTGNPRITLSNSVWTCDTFDNAVYALSALHFFRTYSQMDFGKNQSGKPPSPMWFSAYGNYAFHRVPVLMEKASWMFPNDIDYVGIPEFGSDEFVSRKLRFAKKGTGRNASYTWMPMKFQVDSINLVVQHSPRFWSNWSLNDYRSGEMLRSRNSFHKLPADFANKRGKR
jgi:hypothetical protein